MNFSTYDACFNAFKQKKSRNYFLLYAYTLVNPAFLTDNFTRGIPNDRHYQDKKSLLELLVNRTFSRGKKNTGKKTRVIRDLINSLSRLRESRKLSDVPLSWILAMALSEGSPDRMIQSSRFGSGVLTKAVWMTYPTRINWFLKTLLKATQKRGTKSYADAIAQEVGLALDGTSRSLLLSAKRELDAAVLRANLS